MLAAPFSMPTTLLTCPGLNHRYAGTVAALCPSALLLRFSVPPGSAAVPGSSSSPELVDLTSLSSSGLASLIASGLVLPGLTGPLWGLDMAVSVCACMQACRQAKLHCTLSYLCVSSVACVEQMALREVTRTYPGHASNINSMHVTV